MQDNKWKEAEKDFERKADEYIRLVEEKERREQEAKEKAEKEKMNGNK